MQVNTPTSFEDSVCEPVPLPLPARLASGRIKCWRPKGLVSETFREIYPIILEVAKTHLESRPRTEDVVLGCYMLGNSSRTAVPYISFASRDQKYRRELRKLVQNEVLRKYPGWKSVDWNQDPGSRNMSACGSNVHDTPNSPPILRIKSSTSGFGGSKIFLLQKNGTNEIWQHIATGGGIIANGKGSCFLMTTAHSLPGYEGPSFPLPQSPDEFEFNMDDLSDEEEPDELGVESTSLGSRTPPETRRSSTDELSSRNSQSEEIVSGEPSFFKENVEVSQPTTSAEELQVPKLPLTTSTSDQQTRALPAQEHHPPLYTIYSKTPSITSSRSSHPGLDYALIEVNRIELGNGAQLLETRPPVALYQPGPREVVAITSSHGKTNGRLLETPLFVIRSDTTDSQELWTVILDYDTREGDSGSWVFDATSGEMIGHIVATSAETGSTFIIPAFQVLDDLHQRFDGSWRPITKTEDILVHTSTAVAQQSSAQQSFPEPSTLAISNPIDPQVDSSGGTATSVTAQRTPGAISPRFLQLPSSDAAAGILGDQESPPMPYSTATARHFNTTDPELAAGADTQQPCNHHTKSPPTLSSSHPSSSAERSNKMSYSCPPLRDYTNFSLNTNPSSDYNSTHRPLAGQTTPNEGYGVFCSLSEVPRSPSRGVRSRAQSVSSDRPSTTAHSLMLAPLTVSPEAGFLGASAPSQIVANDHDTHAETCYDQHVVEPSGETTLVSSSARTMLSIYDHALAGTLTADGLTGHEEINSVDPETKLTPLGAAVWHGDIDQINLLLEKGAGPNGADGARPPLWVAASKPIKNAGRIIEILLEHGADPSLPSAIDDNSTPLLGAVKSYKPPAVISALVDAGASPTAGNNRGEIAEQVATKRKDRARLQAMLPRSQRASKRLPVLLMLSGLVLLIVAWANRNAMVAMAAIGLTGAGLVAADAVKKRFRMSGVFDSMIPTSLQDPRPVEQFKTGMRDCIETNLNRFFPPGKQFLKKVVEKAVEHFQQQLQQFQQSALPGMPMLPDDQALFMPRRIQQLMPVMAAPRADTEEEETKQSHRLWDISSKTSPSAPPAYEDIYPQKQPDRKQAFGAQAATDAEADAKCATLYDQALASGAIGVGTEEPEVLKISRKNAITKEQLEQFLRAREVQLKRLSSERDLFFIWIPLLLVMVCAMLYSYFPWLFTFASGN